MDIKEKFLTFWSEIPWSFNETDEVAISNIEIEYSENFITTFPTLFKLLKKSESQLIELNRDNQKKKFYLFTWINKEKEKSGWLCELYEETKVHNISKEHEILIKNIGGITETYTENDLLEEVLTDNQNFLFSAQNVRKGLGLWEEYYLELCKEEDKKPIDYSSLIRFAEEANGNETFYDLATSKVFLFAPDHCFENVKKLENSPELTFYEINNCHFFIDYVNTLVNQWTETTK